MAAALAEPAALPPPADRLPFRNGDRLDQPAFHRLSELLPDSTRAELIEGVVYLPPAATDDHSAVHNAVVTCTGTDRLRTPGVRANDRATVILGSRNEPQPDALLRLQPECGEYSRVGDRYIHGAPELVIEVAVSTEQEDLHSKRRVCEQAGVGEYVVVLAAQKRLIWWRRETGRHVELPADGDGVHRSPLFPGFWLDPAALFAEDGRLLDVLQAGLAAPEQAAFVAVLTQRRWGHGAE